MQGPEKRKRASVKDLAPDDALDLFEDEARAGASDDWLAEQTDVSLRQVRQWRKKKGMLGKSPLQEALSALQGLADSYEPKAHATTPAWTEPSFVLRQPLDYTLFARTCFTLEIVVGLPRDHVAKAIGVRKEDVTQALALWRRHLEKKGTKCLGCDVLIDERFGSFCSRRCHDAAFEH